MRVENRNFDPARLSAKAVAFWRQSILSRGLFDFPVLGTNVFSTDQNGRSLAVVDIRFEVPSTRNLQRYCRAAGRVYVDLVTGEHELAACGKRPALSDAWDEVIVQFNERLKFDRDLDWNEEVTRHLDEVCLDLSDVEDNIIGRLRGSPIISDADFDATFFKPLKHNCTPTELIAAVQGRPYAQFNVHGSRYLIHEMPGLDSQKFGLAEVIRYAENNSTWGEAAWHQVRVGYEIEAVNSRVQWLRPYFEIDFATPFREPDIGAMRKRLEAIKMQGEQSKAPHAG
jgi:hypothetical protein